MPKPKKSESKQDFLKRCTGDLVAAGVDAEQAFAQCNLQWNNDRSERQALTLTAPLQLSITPEQQEAGFLITAYTGAVVERWWGNLVIDVAGIQTKEKFPVLREHARDRVVGYAVKSWREGSNLLIRGDFSKRTSDSQEVQALAVEGFPWQASIGVWPKKIKVLDSDKETVTVNGRKFTGPLEIWTESEVKEVSFVAIGADDNTAAISFRETDGQTVKVQIERGQDLNKETERMKSKILAILGLKAEAEETEILEFVQSGKTACDFQEDLSELLGVKPGASEIKGAVLALKASPDVIVRLQGEVDQLKAERVSEAAKKQLELALRAGKITPAMWEWALNYAKTDPQGFKAYVANAPKIVPVGEKLEHEAEGAKTEIVTLTAEDKQIAALLSVSEESYLKSKIELAERAPAGN